MKFQTRGVLKNHKLRVCCFRNWLQTNRVADLLIPQKFACVGRTKNERKNQAICLRDLTSLYFQLELMTFSGLVNQHDKNVTTVFNSSSNP